MGYGAVILIDTERVMVGLACEDAHGDSIEFHGIEYLYCETTAVGWEIGQLPDGDFSPTVVQVEWYIDALMTCFIKFEKEFLANI